MHICYSYTIDHSVPPIAIFKIIEENPFKSPPPFEKLVGDLIGAYSRRINIQHRVVYQVYEKERVVKIIRLWTHYEKKK